MTVNKQKKYKRLRQRHIWPSVVLLALYIVLAGILITAFLGIFTTYLIETKMTQGYSNALYLGGIARYERNTGSGWDEVSQGICTVSDRVGSAAFVDENNEFLGGFGERTYDMDKTLGLDFGEDKLTVHPDSSSQLLPTRNGELSVTLGQLLRQVGGSGQSALDTACVMSYWFDVPVEDGVRLLVRSEMSISRLELSYVILMLGTCIFLAAIPCVLLVVNIVNAFITQCSMKKLFYTDPLTGGHNRFYIEQHAKRLFKGKNALTTSVAVLSVRKYRSFCACHGTAEGEALLEEIQRQLEAGLKRGELCGRISEADFCAVLKSSDRGEVRQRLAQVIASVSAGRCARHLHWRAGVYMTGENELWQGKADIAQMINNASAACNTADSEELLSDGSGLALAFFDSKLLDDQRWEHTVEENMERALENQEFEVYLQPKYSPADEKLSGAEALIRWISPENGFISPGRFIPIFEKNGFITKIDDYMITHVAAQQARWLAEGKPIVPVSVNVSRAHFANPDLAEHIAALVDEYGVPHEYIEIELTESAFFDDKAALLETVRRLKKSGFDISMDDFGAGYSSLNSLKDLPLDVLKLDAEFFRGEADGRSEVVVSEAIRLAKSLEMRIVAEGVEKKEQVDFLAANGCDMIQGFYFAKPMPIADFEKKHYEAKEQA